MTNRFTYRSHKKTFKSVDDVLSHMIALGEELLGTELANLTYFNTTYIIITKNVTQKIGTGYFDFDKTMQNLDIQFAKYYFDALKDFTIEKKTTPAWEMTFDFCKKNNSIPLIYLAQGVNAHVINDLGLALFDVIENENFKKDYDKVNKIIYDSLDEVISKLKLHTMYKPFMNVLIKNWRSKAWENYIQLKQIKSTRINVEMKAMLFANELAKIHSEKDFYHVLKII